MSNFSAVLQEYQLGLKTLDDVETQIEQELIQDLIPAEELLRRLDEQHSIRSFGDDERRQIERCIWTIETKRRTEFERSLTMEPSGQDVPPEEPEADALESEASGAEAPEPAAGPAEDAGASGGDRDRPGSASGSEGAGGGPADTGSAERPAPVSESPAAAGINSPAQPGPHPGGAPDAEDATRIAPQTEEVGPGTVLGGRYRLEELIGRGGMSQVYRAVDQIDEEYEARNAFIALKVMTVTSRNQRDAIQAMQREVERSKRLTHQSILRVHHFDLDGATAFMTMELLEGQSLLQKMAGSLAGGLPPAEAENILVQVADALQHAHEKGIVHADLKPSNVFIDTAGRVKVIDFGIARAMRNPADPSGQATVFDPRRLGAMTAAYASPEMIEAQEPDPRDDIYSLGCLAYEVYTGKHPFARAQATDVRDSGFEITRPKEIPKEKWPAIRHALEFDQADRTPSALDFIEELGRSGGRKFPVIPAAVAAVVAIGIGAGSYFLAGPGLDPTAETAAEEGTAGTASTAAIEAGATETALVGDCAGCPELVTVPSGSAYIGAEDAAAYPSESPRHRVFIGAPFGLGRTEVTRAQYAAFADETGRSAGACRHPGSGWQPDPAVTWRTPGFPQGDDHPVTCVSYQDAVAYADWLSGKTGQRYRLPSEAEFEYSLAGLSAASTACQAGNFADRSLAGAYEVMRVLDCSDGHAFTAPADLGAGILGADAPVGLRGNVFEWTSDCWTDSYAAAPVDGSPQTQGDCGLRVLRGGSWFTAPEELRITFRNRAETDYRSNTFGFRIVRELDQASS